MNAPCGQEGCDCGHTIEKLERRLGSVCRNSEHCAEHGTTFFAGCLGCDCAAAARAHRASHRVSEAKP